MTRSLAAILAATLLATATPDAPLPAVRANDNRLPAGVLQDGVLTIRLVVQMARWYPEAEDGPSVAVAAFAEESGPPEIPGPLIRVPQGTTIVASIRNALNDSTIFVRGLTTKPVAIDESVIIPAGETRTVRFVAGVPGTYLYRASRDTFRVPPPAAARIREREQLAGAFVVDSTNAAAPQNDRIFLVNIWGERRDSGTYRNALAINGKSWPYTERLTAAIGDSVRWRVINASQRNHPMHLHGFYYRVDARGDFLQDTTYGPDARRLVVTEELGPGHTMALVWQPSRVGNWLFHCHVGFHVVPAGRLEPPPPSAHHDHDGDPAKHMAGLVLGITVRPTAGETRAAPAHGTAGAARQLHLYVQEGRRRGHAARALAFVLQRGDTPPAADSIEIPGSVLVLTRDEPTNITVVNRLRENTAVHWHGIELESYSDGVAGWSGTGTALAPVIAPGDSFTARLTLPRAGTFMYHTHLNDVEQLTSGLYGAIVVQPPATPFTPGKDHVFVVGWDGVAAPPRFVVNGDSLPAPLELGAGQPHRLRFVNIGAAIHVTFALHHDTTLAQWRALAKDGADLPVANAIVRPAVLQLAVGETYDVEFLPPAPGVYRLTMSAPARPRPVYERRLIVH